ncbi:MAG: HEAT repeat domain-containing protein [Deltaproteobacteria bacterium]|nr:HEAT repeat domain-containing protein [Deltaproteobacteria bacterium]
MGLRDVINNLHSDNEFKRRDACRELADIGAEEGIQPLINAFGDDSWLVRESAVEALIKIGGERKMPLLISVLKDEDARVRSSAVEILTGLGEKVLPTVFEALHNDEENIVRYAADVLGDIGDKKSVDNLLKALEHPSEDVLYYVIQALGKIGDVKAVEPLLGFLDRDMWIQSATVEALGLIGDDRAAPRLIELLATDTFIKAQVAEAVSRVSDSSAIPALMSSLGNENEELNNSVIKAIVTIKSRMTPPYDIPADYEVNKDVVISACLTALTSGKADVAKAAAIVLGWLKAEAALAPLAEKLSDEDEALSTTAKSAIVEIGKAAVPKLSNLLTIPYKRARLLSIEAIGDIGDKQGGEDTLIPLLLEEDDDLRRAAVLAVGKLKIESALDSLLGLLDDPSDSVRQAVVQSLGTYDKSDHIFEKLVDNLRSVSPALRKSSAEVMGLVGESRGIGYLEGLLKDPDSGVKQTAVFALAKIEDIKIGSLPVMLLGSDDPVLRKSASIVMGELKDKRAVEPLSLTLLKDENMWVRYHAAVSLGSIGDERAVEPLLSSLKDSVGAVKVASMRALGLLKITTGEVLDALISLIEDVDDDVRRALAEELAFFEDKKSVEALSQMIEDSSWQVREAAVLSIGKVGGKASIKCVETLIDDENQFVREAAEKVLSSLKE